MAEDTAREPQGSRFPRSFRGMGTGVSSGCCRLLRSDSPRCGKGYKPNWKECLLDFKSDSTHVDVWPLSERASAHSLSVIHGSISQELHRGPSQHLSLQRNPPSPDLRREALLK